MTGIRPTEGVMAMKNKDKHEIIVKTVHKLGVSKLTTNMNKPNSDGKENNGHTAVSIQRSVIYLGKIVLLLNLIFTLADLGGGVPGTRPPMGPNSFVFAYIFTEKCPRQRSMPP